MHPKTDKNETNKINGQAPESADFDDYQAAINMCDLMLDHKKD